MIDERLRQIHATRRNPDPDLNWFLQQTLQIYFSEMSAAGGGYHEDQANNAWDVVKLLSEPLDQLEKEEKQAVDKYVRDHYLPRVHSLDMQETGKTGGQNFQRYCRTLNKLAGLSL